MMLLNLCQYSKGIFHSEFRIQLLAAASVTIITFCHGIGLGWFAPMIAKLQSPNESPLNFTATVEQSSWIGSLLSVGGAIGNIIFGQLLDRIGRKACIYCLAIPHICFWLLVYFAEGIEYLYTGRLCAGITGGGTYVVIPIFIGEIADPTIRGRLTSLFTLTLNFGILSGFILSAHVSYRMIPMLVIMLPVLYVFVGTFFPETPTHLLHCEQDEKAERSLQFYQNYKAASKQEIELFNTKFAELRSSVKEQKSRADGVTWRDFFTRRALRAIGTGIILMVVNIFSGSFVLLNYTSSVFVAVQTEIHPDTNTIIIGVVQIIGTYTAIILVDRCGRKILLIISTASMCLGLAVFGIYAYFAEDSSLDLSSYRSWLPLALMIFIIFTANLGVIPVTFVVLVEIMPPKIRSAAASFCLTLLSIFAFVLMKVFPPFMETFGLSTTMWALATFAAFGLFYITSFVNETKGKSMNKDEPDE